MLDEIPTTKQYCHKCGSVMTVELLYKTEENEHIQIFDEDVNACTTHCICKCANCGSITHNIYLQDDYEFEERTNEFGEREHFLPVRFVGHFPHTDLPTELKNEERSKYIPSTILRLLKEGYIASQCRSFTLATVSLRMIVDAICIEAERQNTIKKARREELAHEGLIDQKSLDIINLIYANANAAAHQFTSLNPEQFNSALKIVLRLIDSVYIAPQDEGIIPDPPTPKRRTK